MVQNAHLQMLGLQPLNSEGNSVNLSLHVAPEHSGHDGNPGSAIDTKFVKMGKQTYGTFTLHGK